MQKISLSSKNPGWPAGMKEIFGPHAEFDRKEPCKSVDACRAYNDM